MTNDDEVVVLVLYDEVKDEAHLTPAGVEFMLDFLQDEEFEVPTEISLSNLLVMASLVVRAKGEQLKGLVSEEQFDANMPAVEMPEIVVKIRNGAREQLEEQMRSGS